jgi:hypothetical protein
LIDLRSFLDISARYDGIPLDVARLAKTATTTA